MTVHYRIKKVSDLVEGDIVLHPVFRNDGLLFIKKYKRLTRSVITHIRMQFPKDLSFLVIESEEQLVMFISNEEEQTSSFQEIIRQIALTHQQQINIPISLDEYIDKTTQKTDGQQKKIKGKDNLKMDFLKALDSNAYSPIWDQLETILDSPRVLNRANKINKKLKHLISIDNTLIDLYKKVSQYHDVLLVHSLNSTFIAFMLGLTMEFSDEEIIDLTLASLFADIGFTEIEKGKFIGYLDQGKERINEELTKEHIKKSIEILATSPYCRKKSVIYGVYDHHEQYNGKGLPLQKQGNAIHLFGRIIAIAQYYDEMVGGYLQEKSQLTIDALNELWMERGKKVDPNILRIFIDKANIYKVGLDIQVSNNQHGEISGFRDYIEKPFSPFVKLKNGEIFEVR
ncbi:MAG: diguanylate cyclase [Bacillus sp. (in: Bacteria)]|nr:diguanylate cyclase [Bacillus sp. (in: firmicutes)]